MSDVDWVSQSIQFAARRNSSSPALVPSVVLLLVTAIIAALTIVSGPVRTVVFPSDGLGLLDGGWRIYSGQRIFHDFQPQAAGAGEDLRIALDLWLANGRIAGIGYGNALIASCLSLWSFFLLRSRMNQLACLLASVTLALLIVAPVPLGSLVLEFSRAMEYNRLGYALAGFFLLEIFTPSAESNAGRIAGSLSSGLLLGVMPLAKLTYFLVCVGFLAVAIIVGWVRGQRLVWLLGAAAASFLTVFALAQPQLNAFLGLTSLAGSETASVRLDPVRIFGKAILYQADLWALVVVAYFVSCKDKAWRECLAAAAVYFAGIGLLTTNAQDYGLPLTGIALLILISRALEAFTDPSMTESRRSALAATVLLALVYWLGPVAKDGMSLLLAAKDVHDHPGNKPSETVTGISGRSVGYAGRAEFVAFLNEGSTLLVNADPQKCIATLAMTNPYPYLLGRPPCKHGRSFLTVNTFGDLSKIAQDDLIGDPGLIMAPKPESPDAKNADPLVARFAGLLDHQYKLIGESAHWKLFEKK